MSALPVIEPETDFTFEDLGTLWLCHPQNHVARAHLMELAGDVSGWLYGALCVEPEHALDFAQLLYADGFVVHGPGGAS